MSPNQNFYTRYRKAMHSIPWTIIHKDTHESAGIIFINLIPLKITENIKFFKGNNIRKMLILIRIVYEKVIDNEKSRYHYTNLVIFCFFLPSLKSPIEIRFLYFGKIKTPFLCHMVSKIFKHMFSDFLSQILSIQKTQVFWNLLCRAGWPQFHRDLPPSGVLALKVCAIIFS